ncbi:hypothetical protein U9M48_036133 [Paspalum notatum var. saurae]|uniref:Uncharacterized protein n=1 Tax=Paspalum notatum var. saurae TaxID=547442 RepID=A0AAQ3UIJ0_PASNO
MLPPPTDVASPTRAPLPPPSRHVAAQGDQDEPNLPSPVIDAKERKRQRDRKRYAALSVQKKNEINKKRHEAHMDTDTEQLHMNQTSEAIDFETSGDMATGSDNCSGVDFTNLSTDDVPGLLASHDSNYEMFP